jgi:hypothetical protein
MQNGPLKSGSCRWVEKQNPIRLRRMDNAVTEATSQKQLAQEALAKKIAQVRVCPALPCPQGKALNLSPGTNCQGCTIPISYLGNVFAPAFDKQVRGSVPTPLPQVYISGASRTSAPPRLQQWLKALFPIFVSCAHRPPPPLPRILPPGIHTQLFSPGTHKAANRNHCACGSRVSTLPLRHDCLVPFLFCEMAG